MTELKLAILGHPPEHQETFVRLFQVCEVFEDHGWRCVDGGKLPHLFLHLPVDHNVAHVLNIEEVHILQVLDDLRNEFFLDPDEEHAILHDLLRYLQVFELLERHAAIFIFWLIKITRLRVVHNRFLFQILIVTWSNGVNVCFLGGCLVCSIIASCLTTILAFLFLLFVEG